MEEFKSANSITSRNELTTVWNYWVAKLQLLKMQSKTVPNPKLQIEIECINAYFEELTSRDKELIKEKRSKAAKERAQKKQEEKLAEEERRREYEASLVKIASEVEEDKRLKNSIRAEITSTQAEIARLEEDVQRYAIKIGLPNLRQHLSKLEKDVNKPIITSCKHTENVENYKTVYYFDDRTNYFRCNDCGYTWTRDW